MARTTSLRSFLVAALLLTLTITPAAAQRQGMNDGLRCGENLVQLGQTMGEVYQQCGRPASHYSWTEIRGRWPVQIPVDIQEWSYEHWGSFPRLLRFEGNRLLWIQARSRR